MIDIAPGLTVEEKDFDNEIMLTASTHYEQVDIWIDKEQAIKLITHLKEQFGI